MPLTAMREPGLMGLQFLVLVEEEGVEEVEVVEEGGAPLEPVVHYFVRGAAGIATPLTDATLQHEWMDRRSVHHWVCLCLRVVGAEEELQGPLHLLSPTAPAQRVAVRATHPLSAMPGQEWMARN